MKRRRLSGQGDLGRDRAGEEAGGEKGDGQHQMAVSAGVATS
jgi:hypothetical protein